MWQNLSWRNLIQNQSLCTLVEFMYLAFTLCTLHLLYVPCIYFMYLAFTLCTLHLLYVPCIYFMYLAFTLCTLHLLYVPCIYSHFRWQLPKATRVFDAVLVLRISSANELPCVLKYHSVAGILKQVKNDIIATSGSNDLQSVWGHFQNDHGSTASVSTESFSKWPWQYRVWPRRASITAWHRSAPNGQKGSSVTPVRRCATSRRLPTEDPVESATGRRMHYNSQTPSIGLRHPSFSAGKRCSECVQFLA